MLQKIVDKEKSDESYQPKKQKILLCSWITELKLNEINTIMAQRDNEKN